MMRLLMEVYLNWKWENNKHNSFDAEDFNAGSFNGVNESILYPENISTTNGLTISVWTYRTSLGEGIQTIISKGRQEHFNHFWLYFQDESVMFEIGNGTERTELEAYIFNPDELDYHVKSEYGRWTGTEWVLDSETSSDLK